MGNGVSSRLTGSFDCGLASPLPGLLAALLPGLLPACGSGFGAVLSLLMKGSVFDSMEGRVGMSCALELLAGQRAARRAHCPAPRAYLIRSVADVAKPVSPAPGKSP